MTILRQMPRGTTAQLDALLSLIGNLRMDTTRKELRLFDGVTPGGVRIPSIEQMRSVFLSKDEGLGEEVGFPTEGIGVLIRLNDSTYIVRTLTPGDGIEITHPNGQDDDPEFAVDGVWLQAWLDEQLASVEEVRSGAASTLMEMSNGFLANGFFTIADGAPVPFNLDNGWNQYVEIDANRTLGTPSNVKTQSGLLAIKAVDLASTGASGRTITLGAGYSDPFTLFPLTLSINERAYISYFVDETGAVVIANVFVR